MDKLTEQKIVYIKEKAAELGWKIVKEKTDASRMSGSFTHNEVTPIYALTGDDKYIFITCHFRYLSGCSILPEKRQNEMNDYDATCEIANFLMHEGRYITKKAYYDNYGLYFDDILQLFVWLMESRYLVPVLTFTEERHGKIIVMEGAAYHPSYSSERCPDFRFIYWIYNREFYELVKEKASDMRDCIYHIICKKGHGCDPDAPLRGR